MEVTVAWESGIFGPIVPAESFADAPPNAPDPQVSQTGNECKRDITRQQDDKGKKQAGRSAWDGVALRHVRLPKKRNGAKKVLFNLPVITSFARG